MKYTAFREYQFREAVDKALGKVKTILDVNRNPRYAQDQDHSYDDKYALAEFLTNTAIAGQANVFERMGLSKDKLGTLCDIVQQERRSATLRFEYEDTCTFLKEQTVNVVVSQGDTTIATTRTKQGAFGKSTRKTAERFQHKVKKAVQEYHWNVQIKQRFFCFSGSNPSKDQIEIWSRDSSTVIITTGSKDPPLEKRTSHHKDLSLTWFLQNIKEDASSKKKGETVANPQSFTCKFKIDRNDKNTCCTPRRNPNIEEALSFARSMIAWSSSVRNFVIGRIEWSILGKHSPVNKQPSNKTPSFKDVKDSDIFCPILPLFDVNHHDNMPGTATRQEEPKSLLLLELPPSSSSEFGASSSPLMSVGDAEKFLNEQCRSLDCALESLAKVFPSQRLENKPMTTAEAGLFLLLLSAESLQFLFIQGVEYIENMLSEQLIAAIGKEVKAKDFDQFMSFHNKKLFAPECGPRPFCYAIRRPHHFPDGILTIERKGDGSASDFDPVETIVRHIPGDEGPPISIPINAATSITMTGPRYLHGWMRHDFTDEKNEDAFQLTARARQFSSFLLIVGVMAGPDSFHPKDAIILQNKDEVLIPLLLKQLPTAREFKDAISSLSPEQQQFAKSFRGMQLESSVFGVCVIQMKPQMEVLLGLPQDSLTKEIRLTQDLMTLFVEHQIPSDLLSFDGPEESPKHEKVEEVKENVKAVMDVIDAAKNDELAEAKRKAKMGLASYVGDRVEFDDFDESDECSGDDVRRSGFLGIGPSASYSHATSSVAFAKSSAPVPPPSAPAPAPAPMEIGGAGFAPRDAAATLTASALENPLDFMDSHQHEPAPTKTNEVGVSFGDTKTMDFTLIPKELDAKFEQHDTDSSLRATILETKKDWTRMRQQNLLSKVKASSPTLDDIRAEKNKAFDLLDALSCSGSLPMSFAELHVVVAVTHCFENDVMGTVIQDNINPIEKVERSMVMIASTIHGCDQPSEMIKNGSDRSRLVKMFPAIMDG